MIAGRAPIPIIGTDGDFDRVLQPRDRALFEQREQARLRNKKNCAITYVHQSRFGLHRTAVVVESPCHTHSK